ncbi:MAG: right-handed parallel beta-helix repeat-containing protein [Planctomycetota bacterium]
MADCVIDFGDCSAWSAQQWSERAGDGIRVRSGKNVKLIGNHLKSVADGINVYKPATHVIVRGNTIENFCMDGLRALGDHGLFEENVVKNAHIINDNHCDMLQSWSTGRNGKPGTGVITGVVVRGNRFISHTDPGQPHLRRGRSGVQGIGMFNGVFKDFVIENNLVVADHFHGITVYGANNVRIENNTVIDFDQQFPGPPWIVIKNAQANCVIRRNIRMNAGTSDDRVKQLENIEIRFSDYSKWFREPSAGDFRLVADPPKLGVGARLAD